jgi:hypothetical protein
MWSSAKQNNAFCVFPGKEEYRVGTTLSAKRSHGVWSGAGPRSMFSSLLSGMCMHEDWRRGSGGEEEVVVVPQRF